MKQIEIKLSVNSINDAIKKLKDFKKQIPQMVNELIDRMVVFGEDYAINSVGHIDTGETVNSIVGYRKGNTGFIIAGGNAIWIEFGTGVKHNGAVGSSPHPLGEEKGFTIGTFGNGNGANENGWYYKDDSGSWKHTFGIKANMFMYRTAQSIKAVFPTLAKEVFDFD